MKNFCRLACRFDLDQIERKSSQVNVCARKTWPNGFESCVCLPRAYGLAQYRKDIEKEVSLSELEKLTSTTVVNAEKKNVINAEKWKER